MVCAIRALMEIHTILVMYQTLDCFVLREHLLELSLPEVIYFGNVWESMAEIVNYVALDIDFVEMDLLVLHEV